MLDSLNQIAGFVFSTLTSIFNLYTGTFLIIVLAIWVLRKVSKLFDNLK